VRLRVFLPFALGALAPAVFACSSGVIPIGEVPDASLPEAAGLDVAMDVTKDKVDPTDVPQKDAPSGDVVVFCPTKPPAVGMTCLEIGQLCEYGASAAVECNMLYECTTGGWKLVPASSGGTPCPTGAKCPPTYPSGEVGIACSSDGLSCSYTEGTCNCAVDMTTPTKVDASMIPRWICFPKQKGCPSPRPTIGSKCGPSTASGGVCNYGMCAGGVELECKGGVWVEVKETCPT